MICCFCNSYCCYCSSVILQVFAISLLWLVGLQSITGRTTTANVLSPTANVQNQSSSEQTWTHLEEVHGRDERPNELASQGMNKRTNGRTNDNSKYRLSSMEMSSNAACVCNVVSLSAGFGQQNFVVSSLTDRVVCCWHTASRKWEKLLFWFSWVCVYMCV